MYCQKRFETAVAGNTFGGKQEITKSLLPLSCSFIFGLFSIAEERECSKDVHMTEELGVTRHFEKETFDNLRMF